MTFQPLPVSLAVSDRGLLRLSRQALEAFPPNYITACEIGGTGSTLTASVAACRPAVLVTDLAALGESFGETIRQVRNQVAPPEILVLHNSADGEAILKAMRAGAREFFFEDVETSLRETIKAIALDRRSTQTGGKLHAFFAAKGGSGVTTMSSHAAASLSRLSKDPVLFADLNWGRPSAAFFLRANPQYALQDAAQNIGRMDNALWDAMVTDTVHGFSLAPPPACTEAADPIKRSDLDALLHFWKARYGSVVADCGEGSHPLTPAIIDAADEIVLVTCSDVLALHHAKRLLRSIQDMGGGSRLRLVLNRVRRRPDLRQAEIEEMLGHAIFASVPNDYRSLTQACESGILLAADHPVAQSVAAFTARFMGPAPTTAPRKNLFNMFRN